jgi:hypothetical protein
VVSEIIMNFFQRNKETFTQVELEQFASNVVGNPRPDNTLGFYLQSLHDKVLQKGGYEGNGILKSLENQIQVYSSFTQKWLLKDQKSQ